jgi:hypothetical protein
MCYGICMARASGSPTVGGGQARRLRTPGARWVLLGLVALLAATVVAGAPTTPEETVRRYLQAMKDGKFADAFDLVSRAMTQGKDREVWVKEQQAGMAIAEVKIFEFRVYPGKLEGEKAYVPNVLSSQDRFVNQLGLTEYELYTLVKEDGAWKVDQQVLVEPPDIPKWFPKAPKADTPSSGGSGPGAPSPPPNPEANSPKSPKSPKSH